MEYFYNVSSDIWRTAYLCICTFFAPCLCTLLLYGLSLSLCVFFCLVFPFFRLCDGSRNSYCASDRLHKRSAIKKQKKKYENGNEATNNNKREKNQKRERKGSEKDTRTSQQFNAILNRVTVLLLHCVQYVVRG